MATLTKFPDVVIPQYPVYAMFLRKSREDKEVAEGETLKRHMKQLEELKARLAIEVKPEYVFTEIVSGETLKERTEMQKLLALIETKLVIGVLVVEETRLTRGDKIDQGIIQNTFKYTNTKIITPQTEYNLNSSSSDNTMLDVKLMFARMELESTTNRLRNGRIGSVKEGKYVGHKAPYGYDKVKLKGEKGYTLEKNEYAVHVANIFEIFARTQRFMDCTDYLNSVGFKTKNNRSIRSKHIKDMFRNVVYKGCVAYSVRKTVTVMEDGVLKKKIVPNDEPLICEGIHEPIVSTELWQKVNDIIDAATTSRVPKSQKMVNQFSNIMKCGVCGAHMRMVATKAFYERTGLKYYCCGEKTCKCRGKRQDFIENAIMDKLDEWLAGYEVTERQSNMDIDLETQIKALDKLGKEMSKVENQINNLSDLLEQGVYSIEKYTERSNILEDKKRELKTKIDACKKEVSLQQEFIRNKTEVIPRTKSILQAIQDASDVETKNVLWKSILKRIEYTRTKDMGNTFELKIYPILPSLK